MLQQPRPLVPFMFPKRSYSFETLLEYLSELSGLVAYYPLDDASGNMARVINPAVALGRELVLGGNPINASFWTLESGITVSGGEFVYTSTTINNKAQQAVSMLTIGKTYETVIEVSNYSAGAVRIEVGSGGQGTNRSANGTYAQTITCSGNVALAIRAVTGITTLNVRIVSVKQVNIPASSAIADTELLADGDMEAVGTAAWTAGNGATLSKQTGTPRSGAQVLRVARSVTNNPDARQASLTIGRRYRFNGYGRSDGTALPRPSIGASFLLGTTSTSWQPLDLLGEATLTLAILQAQTSTGTTYAEFDDCSVIEVPPMSGYNGNGVAANVPTVNQDAGSKLLKSYSFDGSNDFVNLYSADLNSAFNPDEGTLLVFAKVSGSGVWTDGTTRILVNLQVDANNRVELRKASGNNQLSGFYIAGGTSDSATQTGVTTTDFFMLALTWSKSADQLKLFLNGVQVGSTATTLGTWVGNLATTGVAVGALTTAAANPFSGQISHPTLVNRALSDAEIYRIAKLGGVAA